MDGTMSEPQRRFVASPLNCSCHAETLRKLAIGTLAAAMLLVGCNRSEETAQTTDKADVAAENLPASEQNPAPAEGVPLDDAPLWPADNSKTAAPPPSVYGQPPADAPPPAENPSLVPLVPAPSDSSAAAPTGDEAMPPNPLRSGNGNAGVRPLAPLTPPPSQDAAPTEMEDAADSDAGPLNAPIRQPKSGDDEISPSANAPATPPKKKEPLFEGWPKPAVALVITGQQNGYIEPCGCTGLANQKGGLARRHTFIRSLRERGWPVVPLDVGNQTRRVGEQEQIKFARAADALREMEYAAVAFGSEDLRLPMTALINATNPDGSDNTIFVGANVAVLTRELQPTFKVIEAGGKKIGVTAVLGAEHEEKLKAKGDDFVHEPPLPALKAAAAALQAQKCDYYVLLAHASIEETKTLAKEVPIFDVVVTSGGYGEPTAELEQIPGTKSLLAQVGTKGMYAGVVGFFDDKQQPIRYQRVPLDDRFSDSPEMRQLMAEYQKQLEQLGLDELKVFPRKHPSGHQFVGSETCAGCHTKAAVVWEKTSHAHATESLIHPGERGDVPRHFDPECLSCHVTGWEPQKYYPFEGGYLSLQDTPHMQHNGCENCHGPGSAHVAAENGEGNPSAALIEQLRNDMRLPLAGGVAERKCMECHDLDNSPDFHLEGAFEKYWKKVEHKGKD